MPFHFLSRAHDASFDLGCGAALCLMLLVGCAQPRAIGPTHDVGMLLDRCQEQRDSPDVTAWTCGDLTAVEAVVLSATDREISMAFEDFASNFGGRDVRRVDSAYAKGDTRHTTMRLEGRGKKGESLEAQMVAVVVGRGVRLVTCSDKIGTGQQDVLPAKPTCGEVITHLVQGVSPRVSKATFTLP